jgi:hypothetical protein
MEDNPSQKGLDKWDSEDDADLDDIEDLDLILEETRNEVKSWMNTYGRTVIREWLQDNTKRLLAADGLTFKKAPESHTTEKSIKTSSKKPVYKKQKRASYIDVDGE